MLDPVMWFGWECSSEGKNSTCFLWYPTLPNCGAEWGTRFCGYDGKKQRKRQKQIPKGNDGKKSKDNYKSNNRSRFPRGMTERKAKAKAKARAKARARAKREQEQKLRGFPVSDT